MPVWKLFQFEGVSFWPFLRIYTAFIKIVDDQARTSNWGTIKSTGELLHEFQSGSFESFLSKCH